jgi:two-component system chemotaxis response regulator CheB
VISGSKTKVLVVDDSAIVRKLIADGLRKEPDIEVVGGAADPFMARDLIIRFEPDVLTLDIEMPRMDGLTFLRKLMEHKPTPVIIVSSVTQRGSTASIDALRAGAIDVIAKPGGPHEVAQVVGKIVQRVRGLKHGITLRPAAHVERVKSEPQAPPIASGRRVNGLIAIGASTGGTQAIESVLTRLPADTPPICIVQHMPPNFTRAFAERLNGVCPMRVVEAKGDELLERGVAYIAPGDYHMTIERVGVQLRTRLNQGPPVCHQRPAVDVMFNSIARLQGISVVAALLTGMGSDGADGMVALRQAGAETIAEDERSCVVFGMPKEAIARGGAVHVATLLRLPHLLFECFDKLAAKTPGKLSA